MTFIGNNVICLFISQTVFSKSFKMENISWDFPYSLGKRLTRDGTRKSIGKCSCWDFKYKNNSTCCKFAECLQSCCYITNTTIYTELRLLSRVSSSAVEGGWIARLYTDQLAEGLTEFGVEHSVYYRIHKAVHVAQPGSDDEGCNTRLTSLRQLRADCIHDIASEEWHPAY